MEITRISTLLIKHSPEVLTGIGIAGTVAASIMRTKQSRSYNRIMYEVIGEEVSLVRYLRMTKSNNWLKMHGYPMRRKH